LWVWVMNRKGWKKQEEVVVLPTDGLSMIEDWVWQCAYKKMVGKG